MPFATNTTCLRGRYTLLTKLGAGGQSEVWRARDHERGEEIALKILNPDVARSPGAWEALEREHAVVSRLDHPLILKVFEPGRDDDEGIMALPMELAPGGDLRRLRSVSYLEIGPILLELAEALAHAHTLGIVHRDLKPENVLFDARGHVRLADFGIAGTVLNSDSISREPARTGGSPFTASPEQLCGEPPAVSDDIYGLGALAYELLSGHPPYFPRFDLERMLEESVPPLKPTHQTPQRLIALVTSMLARSRSERPGSMREVIDALDATLNDTLILEQDGIASVRTGANTGTGTSASTGTGASASATSTTSASATSTSTSALPRPTRERATGIELTQELPRLGSAAPIELTQELPRLGSAAAIEPGRERPRVASHATTWLPPKSPRRSGPDAVRTTSSPESDGGAQRAALAGAEDTQSLDVAWARAIVQNSGRPMRPPGAWPVRARSGPVTGPDSRRTPEAPETRPQEPPWVRTEARLPKRTPQAPPGARTAPERVHGPAFEPPIPASARLPDSWRRAVESRSSRAPEAERPSQRANGAEAQPAEARLPASAPDSTATAPLAADSADQGARGAVMPGEDLRTLWADIRVERMPSLMRLEPERRSRWPWVLLAGLAAAAVAGYEWLPPRTGGAGSVTQVHWPSTPEMLGAMRSLADAARRIVSSATSSPHAAAAPGAGGTGASTATGAASDANAVAGDRGAAPRNDEHTVAARASIGSGASVPKTTDSIADAAASGAQGAAGSVTQPPAPSHEALRSSGTRPRGEASRARGASRSTWVSRSAGAGGHNAVRHLDAHLAGLDARGAAVWGGADYADAQAREAKAVSAERVGDLATARGAIIQANRLLEAVEQEAPHALAVQLYAGERALAAGNRSAAQRAFELAYRIDPDDPSAEQGLQSARVLDGVRPLVADGLRAEAARNYARAAQDYGQVLALDPRNAKARAGLRRVNLAWGGGSYGDAVAAGFAALGAGRLDDARAAFSKALRINGRGRDAFEGIERVNAALRSRGLAELRSRAATLESEERWGEALNDYEAALRLDPSLSFAREGKQRASAHLNLTNQLEALIDNPQQLASPEARADATRLIRETDAEPSSAAVLRSLGARLSLLLSQYDKTVHLELDSDNQTEIEIQQIGSFGTFSRREIDLKPGKYTVIGTRAGYRAVRRDVTVAPGQDAQIISVRCEEPI